MIGSLLGSRWDPPREVPGVLLAFASGALISALAFELFEDAYELGGTARSGLALLAFEQGHPLNAFATTAGFFLSFVLAA